MVIAEGKAQHVDLWRKVKLRRDLLEAHPAPGAAFVPFLGEGDIAAELYRDRRIVGIELDADVARSAGDRLAELATQADGWRPLIVTGDAEVWHDDAEIGQPYAIVDVDAFSNPYRTLAVAWPRLELADRVAIFGTDGMRLAIRQSKTRTIGPLPEGKLVKADISAKRRQWNTYWPAFVRPWLAQLVAPFEIVAEAKYLRSHMIYWGVVVDRRGAATGSVGAAEADELSSDAPPPTESSRGSAPATDLAKVEAALLEAAQAGNVSAAIFWLEHKGGPTWQPAPPTHPDLAKLTRPLARPRARRDR